MKQIVYFIICMTVFSCGKKEHAVPVDAPGSGGFVQYKVNVQLMVMDNINILENEKVSFAKQLPGNFLPATRYVLYGQKEPNNFLTIALMEDSLEEINYHYDSAFLRNDFSEFVFDLDNYSQLSSLFFKNDYFDLNITSYKNARISGTFSGRFSPVNGSVSDYGTNGSVFITEGILNNVPVTY